MQHNIRPEIEHLAEPIGQVRLAAVNSRQGDLEEIRTSLRVNGQYTPIVVREETGETLVGNHRLMAAREEDWTHIAVLRLSVPDDQDAERIKLVDNRTSDLATYDFAVLRDQLNFMVDLTGTGFTPGDQDKILAQFGESLDDPPAPPIVEPAETRPGDVITLGQHRLVCGDARQAGTWQQLLGADPPAAMIWTDPPYGIDAVKAARSHTGKSVKARMRAMDDIAGDGPDPLALQELLTSVLEHAATATRPGGAIYACHGDLMRVPAEQALRDAGFYHAQTLIWEKDSLVPGRQDYQWRHEPILYGWRLGAGHTFYGHRSYTTVITTSPTLEALQQLDHDDLVALAHKLLEDREHTIARIARVRVAEDHPTSKPVDLIAPHLRNSSQPGDLVLDPFAGSGSTVIAAEQTDRLARVIELDPRYCDVIVTRWEELTGRQAERPARRRRRRAA